MATLFHTSPPAMLFKRFYDERLAQASYLIGCQQTGDAIVIDPNMDVDVYVQAAERDGVRITHVTETHIHADFASGARTLASRTGATLHLSGEGGEGWQYAFAHDPGVNILHDGDRIRLGNVMIDAVHTPGHTPEHLTFLVTDTARNDAPVGAVTGDFLFVGDVGRPDLLERAAGQAGTMQASAAALYRSIQKFKTYPDYLQIWPGHGAGSACGKAMSSAAQSTLGYEKIANWAFEPMSEEEFVTRVLEGQPPAPPYFGAMKIRNRDGGAPRETTLPRKLDVSQLRDAMTGANAPFVIDVRNRDEWDAGHLRGVTLIPLPELHMRLGEIPRDRPVVVHCQLGGRSAKAAATLDAFAFEDVHDVTGGYVAWQAAGFPIVR